MNRHFIKVKHLLGELVLSHRKGHLKTSITTKEIYFQKPNHTYHILFDDIVSIVPYRTAAVQDTFHIADELKVHSQFSQELYKVKVSEMVVLNRHGRYLRQDTDIILPLSDRFLEKVNQYTDLTGLPVQS
ncbi:hypothetical protein [Caldalkalibacillus salinus]|uniref:hypothetical protein n=1 Tax=Caldalkalibacillus salinus TaxID=2803787 RepID=UPI001923C7D9|nr:hypothetical protein [Caldalkalibacillus salinus]